MKKRFLNSVNVVLGALSVGLVGCHTGKKATTDNGPRPQMMKYGVPTEVIAMYGVPVDLVEEGLTPMSDTIPSDTTVAPAPAPVQIEEPTPAPEPDPRDRPMTKYGIPNPRIY